MPSSRTICLLLAALSAASTRSSDAEENKRYVIIHADDAGMSHSVNMATIEAMEKGVVSSASIMVPCPWFSEFAEYARQHPDKDFGIHLTLNSEWKHYKWGPTAPRDKVPSLCDENGHLWRSVPEVAEHVKADEVAIELRAQIERARQAGVPISHFDTHMGALVSRPDLAETYVQLGVEYKTPVLFTRSFSEENRRQYPALVEKGEQLLALLDRNRLPVLDGLAQFYGGDTQESRQETYLQQLRDLEPGVHQIIIHCGFANEELRAITGSAENRDGDRRIFTDPQVIAEIERLGIEVISWRQFRAMSHAQRP